MTDLTGYDYAYFVRSACKELHEEIKVVPVLGFIHRESRWVHVLCHPDDKDKTAENEFKYPFRDI